VIYPPSMLDQKDFPSFSGDKEMEMNEAVAVYETVINGVPA